MCFKGSINMKLKKKENVKRMKSLVVLPDLQHFKLSKPQDPVDQQARHVSHISTVSTAMIESN